jgi:peptidyl-prolyl cis-trans isomerase SurA
MRREWAPVSAANAPYALTIPDPFCLLKLVSRRLKERQPLMKRSIFFILLCCLIPSALGAQVLDKTASTVRLTKTESITVSQLQKTISQYETSYKRTLTTDERKQVLDMLVSNILLTQAAARDNVVISDAQMKTVITNAETQMGSVMGLGRAMSDTELEAYIKSQGMAYDMWKKNLRDQQTQILYVQQKRKSMFDAVKPATDQEIQEYYDSNKQKFFMDDMVTLKHIFIDTRQLTAKDDKDKAEKHAQDILKELKAGASFNDLVMKYSEETKTKYSGGILGTVLRSNAQAKQVFGASFFDAIFKLKKGEVSGVIQSNVGYHIVLVTEKYDARLYALDDKIPPDNKKLIRDAVSASIATQREADVFKDAQADVIAELKKKAEIKTFSDNIGW